MMLPIADMPITTAAQIRAVFVDIDDTLTSYGQLPAVAYTSLELLKNLGLAVVPVTGRPAGWCDMIARFWPVDGIVGENGSLYFSYNRSRRVMKRIYSIARKHREDNHKRLKQIAKRVLQEVPGSAIANDQNYRESDMAIDFCEDVVPLSVKEIYRIKTIFEAEGATAKISSIHVNAWFGNYDKMSMTRRFAREVLDMDIDRERHRVIYCGDSPNDEPMFAHFPNACGVANVHDFIHQLQFQPTWVATNRGGEGFAEISTFLINAHRTNNK